MVVTKDEDFRTTHLLSQKPDRLLHITCGNISTTDLLALVAEYFDELMDAVETHRYVELSRAGVILHDRP